ncbi:hypothetical protein LZV00_11045 [Pseudomonas kielensis]|uniref:hypothetical protein n=1 Tax=Pseudomonas kielensis TaxID=2762577 RepID=UPI00223EAD7F|nr:hypothetical protein [Pseudomonas kielensis]UZM16206.1 hypothetical protein LZV00_11045 [Pseudomonas kielensis]
MNTMRNCKNKAHQIATSIQSMVKLIRHILTHPEHFTEDEHVRSALKSQGALSSLTYLAEFESESIAITPVSLTTLKSKIYSITGDVSFELLDKMRLEALSKLQRCEALGGQKNRRSKQFFAKRITQLELDLNTLRENNLHILQALLFAMNAIDSIGQSETNSLRKKRTKDAKETIQKILTLNTYPFDNLNHNLFITSGKLVNDKDKTGR